ncbi:MAG: STAS domain-containing protein [Magnetococcales bacterium]|nr:STAS domain-containing protein [Magnetococcales bacterium]
MITVTEPTFRVTVHLPAEFNFRMHQAFRECYCHRDPGQAYEIDFQDVTTFDSSALGMLLLMRSHCGDDKADIILTNCSPRIKKILAMAMFGDYFSIA